LNLLSPLLFAGIVAVTGLAVIPWVLRAPTRIRIGFGFVYLIAYSWILSRAGIWPMHPGSPSFKDETLLLVEGLQVLWWFVVARCLIAIGRVFLLYRHKLREVKFAADLLSGVVYLAVSFAVINLVFDIPVTGLVATSGVVAIVLGLALQSTMSDVFSGLALSLERPYKVGDWVALEGDIEGTVIENTWRATHILTSTQDNVVVPNSLVAKSRIVNYSSPVRVHGVNFDMSFEIGTPPERGIEILEHALLQCPAVLRGPPPVVTASHLGTAAVRYSVSFFVDRYEAASKVKSQVLGIIYRHAEWAGVALGSPGRGPRAAPAPLTPSGDPAMVAKLLERTPILATLAADEQEALKAAATRRDFSAGDIVFEQGDATDSLFLIGAGVVSASRADENGTHHEIVRLGPGDFVGANVLLAEMPRTGTIRAITRSTLYELPKSAVKPLFDAHPDFIDHLRKLFPSSARPDNGQAGSTAGASKEVRSRWLDQFARLLNFGSGV
jgi:small-conductance mechanosensitive channel/CRP-like cAMP-binding protein